jgi:hypothetical protein
MSDYLRRLERERKLEKIRGKVGAPAPGRSSRAPDTAGNGHVKIDRNRCGPRKGSLSAAERDMLPGTAFAQPKARKYPMYVVDGGAAVPDREHAINAKARAAQQHDAGRMSRAALGDITRRANVVIALCDRIEGKA